MEKIAKIVARFVDGRVLKGTTRNFDPARPTFLLQCEDAQGAEQKIPVRVGDLKAVFFVRDLAGNPTYTESKEFAKPMTGRRMVVRFADGERLVGVSLTYDETREGFFLFPADGRSNNERVYVVRHAVAGVERA